MKALQDTLQKSVDTLSPKIDKEIKNTKDRLKTIEAQLTPKAIKAGYEALLSAPEALPAVEAVPSILSDYTKLIPSHRQREGAALISSLTGIKRHNGLTAEQAASIAGAIVLCVTGKASSGLIQWPTDWMAALSDSCVKQFAAWLSPNAYTDTLQELSEHAAEQAKSVNDVLALEASKQALAKLVPVNVGSSIRIKNNAPSTLGLSNLLKFERGEVKTVSPEMYMNLLTHAGFQMYISNKSLELVA